MIFRRFRIHVAGRVLMLGATIFLFFYLLLQTDLYVTIALVGLAVGMQGYSLVHYVEKTNRDLRRFLQAVQYEDFSQSFTEAGLGSSFDELYAAFNEVMAAFKRARVAEEANYRYLQTVVQHIGIGLIAFKRNGNVALINTAAKRLLKITHLKHILALEEVDEQLARTLPELQSGEKALIKIDNGGELLDLAVYATAFKLQEEQYTLVSLQNIGIELEEREMEAWQNLTRVLAHEIMNSVTPIASLAGTVNEMLDEPAFGPMNGSANEIVGDMRGALQTIEKRSQGLLHFVDAYRDLARIPRPSFQVCSVADLFGRIERLMRPHLAGVSIPFSVHISPPGLELIADAEMIEQVLINLIKNAIEALEAREKGPRIELNALIDERGKTLIQVVDNGQGISQDQLDKIFVPFFTTKKTGSGIGLSFSRQVMRLHGGTLRVHSRPGELTVFTLRF